MKATRFTAIANTGRRNDQIDLVGNEKACIDSFEGWCLVHLCQWGHLMLASSGEIVASFTAENGLVRVHKEDQ